MRFIILLSNCKNLFNILNNESHVNRVKLKGNYSLFYDKGTLKEKYYIFTDYNAYNMIIKTLEQDKFDTIVKNDLHNISNRYLILYHVDNYLIIITDRFGKIPIFLYSSLEKIIITTDLYENSKKKFQLLNPNSYIRLNLIKNKIEIMKKPAIIGATIPTDESSLVGLLASISESSVLESVKNYQNVGLLFSGGVDSSIIAYILKKNNIPFTAFVVGTIDSPDVINAKRTSKNLNLNLKIIKLTEEKIEKILQIVENIAQTKRFSSTVKTVPRVVTLEIMFVLYYGVHYAVKYNCDVILSSIGTEEMFIGFSLEPRHLDQSKSLTDISMQKMFSIFTRDMYKDYRLSSHFNIDFKTPLLNEELFQIALSIPIDLKIKNNCKKYIWRKTGIILGLPEEIAFRKNKATQFGSFSSKLLEKSAKKHGFKYKKDFIESKLNEKQIFE